MGMNLGGIGISVLVVFFSCSVLGVFANVKVSFEKIIEYKERKQNNRQKGKKVNRKTLKKKKRRAFTQNDLTRPDRTRCIRQNQMESNGTVGARFFFYKRQNGN